MAIQIFGALQSLKLLHTHIESFDSGFTKKLLLQSLLPESELSHIVHTNQRYNRYLQIGKDCLWVVQTEATFEVHKYPGIVLGNKTNLISMDDDGRPLSPIVENMQATITNWKTRHTLAREFCHSATALR
jgi:hypothetical protein